MDEQQWGPVWVLRPSDSVAGVRHTFPSVLRSQTALRWYAGGGISLIWLGAAGTEIVHASGSAASAALGLVLLGLFAIAFLGAAPINWTLAVSRRFIAIAVVFALSFSLWPWLEWGLSGIWTYVGVLIAAAVFPWRVTWPSILGLALLALVFGVLGVGWNTNILWVPAIIGSISLMMAAFIRSIDSVNRMRLAQREVERLAAERERGRVARDIHDILGHSLTVITVKSELAGRLVDADPQRAKTEIAEVEALARAALADVRATVAGFRGVSVSGELAAARVALAAADVALDAPTTTDAVPPDRRELAGWVVREGVTNVVRHAEAKRCRIRLESNRIAIEDDGVGPAGANSGTGLSGLRERVDAAGGILAVGRSDLGGFRLEVTL
ncbi:sensor histidine kinase [Microbacterium sp. ASV49]|uniref:Sensor histidine kinase n=1 Tax=Microbacterium candidum TaxID=3041922 RepID=A0ABT7MU81_9MICO|nr:sensor histidine kinase [Microbacterium sp. ASV49]MDL9978006.1 sensor histidine kinase [Microbacterium sp. ASV49]